MMKRKEEIQSLSINENFSKPSKIYLNDPTTPNLFLEKEIPKKTNLPINSIGDFGGGFEFGTVQQQASACRGTVDQILGYMIEKTPKPIKRWATCNSLTIIPRAGKDINAYYDRSALKFFFFESNNKNIFSCDSKSVVTHEFGHAFLDILRPDIWSMQSAEIWAFHESFGDMTAILANLQHDELIELAIKETNGNLLNSNILSRLASEMGQGIFQLTEGKNGELKDCLRDVSIKYEYTQPEKLKLEGRDDEIVNECHSFSRILSNAFYEIIVKISEKIMKDGKSQIIALKEARDVAAFYLINATLAVPATVRFFDAIAKQILYVDKINGEKYGDIISNIFLDRKIIKPQVKMLDVINIDEIIKDIKHPYEIHKNGQNQIIIVNKNSKIKVKDHIEIMALNDNPLLSLEIDIPNQVSYFFNENSQLEEIISAQDSEIFDAAFVCLDYLNKNNLVGDEINSLFSIEGQKLVRKQIVCKCGLQNQCNPNAPEYGKGWKPANNAGCMACKSCKPRSCDCDEKIEKPIPNKTGCYTTVRTGTIKNYKVGQFISRKVC